MPDKTAITFLGHAAVLIEMNGMRILTDPLLRNRLLFLKRQVPGVSNEHLRDIDIVLISHAHLDHLDIPSLRMVNKLSTLVTPYGIKPAVNFPGAGEIIEIKEGDQISKAGIRITAVPAVHEGARWVWGEISPSLGYLIEGERTIYFAGDTELFPEMEEMSGKLDAGLIPIWGWGPRPGTGHLDPQSAAQAVRLLKPKVAIPIHWGAYYPLVLNLIKPANLVDPPRKFETQTRKIAPETEVIILPPGERFEFDSRI